MSTKQITIDAALFQTFRERCRKVGVEVRVAVEQLLRQRLSADDAPLLPPVVQPWEKPPFWVSDHAVIAWQRDRELFERLSLLRRALEATEDATPLWHALRAEVTRLEATLGLTVTDLSAIA